jgi:hypothetical protein
MKCVVDVLRRPSAGTSQDSQFVGVVASNPHEYAEKATDESTATANTSSNSREDSQLIGVVASSRHENTEEATEDSLAVTNPDSDSNRREDSRLVGDVGSSQRTSDKEGDVGGSNFYVVEFVGRGASGQENDAGSGVCVIGRRKG